MRGRWDLKNEEWAIVEPVLRPARREDDRGRSWHETRSVLNRVFWCSDQGRSGASCPSGTLRFRLAIGASSSGSGRQAGRGVKLLAAHLHGQGRLNLDKRSWMPPSRARGAYARQGKPNTYVIAAK